MRPKFLAFEDAITVILKELRMGTRSRIVWHLQKSIRIDQALKLQWHQPASNEDAVVVFNRKQPSIEHPMGRSAKRKTISDGIRPFMPLSNGSYVRCFHLRTSASIDQL